MGNQTIVEKFGLKDVRHEILLAVTILLVAIGLVLTVIELVSSYGDAFWFARVGISCAFFIAAIVFTTIGYRYHGMLHVRILIGFRELGVVLNIIACMLATTVTIRWWVYVYLVIVLVGIAAFYFTLDKPNIAKPIIIGLIAVALIYCIARNVILGQTAIEAFRPILFEYILAVVYWSKLTREKVAREKVARAEA